MSILSYSWRLLLSSSTHEAGRSVLPLLLPRRSLKIRSRSPLRPKRRTETEARLHHRGWREGGTGGAPIGCLFSLSEWKSAAGLARTHGTTDSREGGGPRLLCMAVHHLVRSAPGRVGRANIILVCLSVPRSSPHLLNVHTRAMSPSSFLSLSFSQVSLIRGDPAMIAPRFPDSVSALPAAWQFFCTMSGSSGKGREGPIRPRLATGGGGRWI